MQIYQLKSPQKCAVKGCDSPATTFFEGKRQKICLCEDCLTDVMQNALSKRVPKSPENTIKRIIQNKEKNNV